MPTYPDPTFETAAIAAGANVQCLWQMKGPRSTGVAWMECLSVNGSVVLVQTYEGGGWEVYSACRSNSVAETIADAFARCGITAKAA